MAISLDEYASFLAGDGNPDILLALNDPHSDASRYLTGMQLAASDVPTIDLIALEFELATDVSPGLSAEVVSERLSKLLLQTQTHRGSVRPALDSLWQELSRPFRAWFWCMLAEQLAKTRNTVADIDPLATVAETAQPMAVETTVIGEAKQRAPSEAALDALRNVSENQWLVFVLHSTAERRIEEIAELLGRSSAEIEHWRDLADVTLADAK